eukprot:m.112213 g.112213  ORF g.112213 m.112213 type:complete len:838 (+) comp12779_c1_seq2:605-3118(+)
MWAAFGVPQSESTAAMIGSDVTVVGFANSQPFAKDYFLTAKSQCDYQSASSGVCPDSLLGDGSDNHVQLIYSQVDSGVAFVAWKRPLDSGDTQFDNPFSNSLRSYVYAMGPLTESSSGALPIVLYHGANRADPSFKLDLSKSPAEQCDFLSADNGGDNSGSNNNTDQCGVANIAGVTTFVVTTGTNYNYPNPPAWGLSYHINNFESPVLRVQRGVEYTFVIKATNQHPLYITNDIIGGRANADMETVEAGSETAWGTESEPYNLTWTPTDETPDVVYYQCWFHQKFGWRIQVEGMESDSSTNAPTTTAATTSGQTTTTTEYACDGACTCDHEYVGRYADFTSFQHRWGGRLTIVDDCTFRVDEFSYDGNAPAAYWWGASDTSQTALRMGFRLISSRRVSGAPNGGVTRTLMLDNGVTWDDVNVLAGWCETFNAVFGYVDLRTAMGGVNNNDGSDDDDSGEDSTCTASTRDDVDCMAQLSDDFTLHWRVNGENITMVAEFSNAPGWVGIGIPETSGLMIGSDAVIASDTIPPAPYDLNAKSLSGVVASTTRQIFDPSYQRNGTNVEVKFTRFLDNGASVITENDDVDFVWAIGQTNTLAFHGSSKGSFQVNLAESQTTATSASSSDLQSSRYFHAVCMSLAWAIILPLGPLFANALKHSKPVEKPMWFKMHLYCQLIGMAFSTVGFIYAIIRFRDSGLGEMHSHKNFGIVIMCLTWMQAGFAFVRPKPKATTKRAAWELAHWLLGRVLIVLGILNLLVGVQLLHDVSGEDRRAWFVGFATAFLVVYIIAEFTTKAFTHEIDLLDDDDDDPIREGDVSAMEKYKSEDSAFKNGATESSL